MHTTYVFESINSVYILVLHIMIQHILPGSVRFLQ